MMNRIHAICDRDGCDARGAEHTGDQPDDEKTSA